MANEFRNKRAGRATDGKDRSDAAMPAHAHLLDCDGEMVGGAARDGDESVIVLGGRPVARTENPAMAIAMLKRTVAVRNAAGRWVSLRYSDTLRDAATTEAQAVGKSLEEMLLWLEQERAERTAPGSTPTSRPN